MRLLSNLLCKKQRQPSAVLIAAFALLAFCSSALALPQISKTLLDSPPSSFIYFEDSPVSARFFSVIRLSQNGSVLVTHYLLTLF